MERIRYSRYKRFIAPVIRSKKTQAYGIIIFSLLTASFFLVFAIRPTLTTITEIRKEIKDNKLVEAKLTEKVNTLTNLSQIYNKIESELSIINRTLPPQPSLEDLLEILETTAFQNRVEIVYFRFSPVTLFQPKKEKMKFQTKPIVFKVSFLGDYQNLLAVMDSLSRSGRMIKVEKFQMKKSKKEEEKLILEITGKSFYVD